MRRRASLIVKSVLVFMATFSCLMGCCQRSNSEDVDCDSFSPFARNLIGSDRLENWCSTGSLEKLRSSQGQRFLKLTIEYAFKLSSEGHEIIDVELPLQALASVTEGDRETYDYFTRLLGAAMSGESVSNLTAIVSAVSLWASRYGAALAPLCEKDLARARRGSEELLSTLVVSEGECQDAVPVEVWHARLKCDDMDIVHNTQLILMGWVARKRGVHVTTLDKIWAAEFSQQSGIHVDTVLLQFEEPLDSDEERLVGRLADYVSRKLDAAYFAGAAVADR